MIVAAPSVFGRAGKTKSWMLTFVSMTDCWATVSPHARMSLYLAYETRMKGCLWRTRLWPRQHLRARGEDILDADLRQHDGLLAAVSPHARMSLYPAYETRMKGCLWRTRLWPRQHLRARGEDEILDADLRQHDGCCPLSHPMRECLHLRLM